MVVYANAIHKTEIDRQPVKRWRPRFPYMKGYTVFNVEQIDGLPDRYHATLAAPVRSDAERDAQLDAFLPRRTPRSATVAIGRITRSISIDPDAAV